MRKPKRFVVRADLPGVKPADIEITADKGVLRLRGARNFEQRNDDGHYSRVERVQRQVRPDLHAARERADRRHQGPFKDGVLELTIPKVAKAEPRRIEVQAAWIVGTGPFSSRNGACPHSISSERRALQT